MAQDVEKKMPDAVGVMGGYKTVDYGKVANENAKHRATGGGVWEPGAYNLGGREHHSAGNAVGGSQMLVDPTDWAALVQAHAQMTNPYGASGANKMGTPGATGVVPAANLAVPKLVQANAPQMKQGSSLHDAVQTGKDVASLAQSGSDLKNWAQKQLADKPKPDAKPDATSKADLPSAKANPVSLESQSGEPSGFKIPEGNTLPSSNNVGEELTPPDATPDLEGFFAYGGVVPRNHFATGGYSDPYKLPDPTGEQLPSDTLKASESSKDEAEKEAPKPGKTGGGGGDSTMSDIGAAASIFGTAAKVLPFFLASGGVVPREHHDGSEGNVVGDGGGSDAPTAHPADETFFSRVIPQESGGKQFDKNGNPLTSKAGAIGIAQVMPTTAPEAAKMAGMEFDPVKFKNDPDYNSKLGQAYLRTQWDRYGGDQEKAMAAYNAGPGNVDKALAKEAQTGISWKNFLPDETKNYIGARGERQGEAQPTNRRNSSIGDVFSEMTSDAVPSGKNFWIPLLSAIATAGASRAPTRGQALAEGLAGGISGYMSTKDLEMKQAKQMIDFTKDNFVHTVNSAGQDVLYNKMTGAQYTPADFNAYMYDSFIKQGIDPAIYGIKKPANYTGQESSNIHNDKAAQIGTITKAATMPDHAVPAPDIDKPSANINTMNTGQLYQAALEGKIPGVPADSAQQQAQIKAQLDRANTLAANPDPNVANNGIKLRELALAEQKVLQDRINQAIQYQADQNKDFAKGRTDRINNYNTEVQSRAPSYNAAFTNLERLAQLGAEHTTGQGNKTKADAVGLLQSAGLGRFVPADWQNIPGDYDQIMKQSTALMFNQLQADKIVRAEKTGLNYEEKAIPSPSTNPAAFYALVGQKLAEAHQSYDKDMAWAKTSVGTTDPVAHELNWPMQKGNDLNDYKRRAYASIPANPNIKDEEFASLQNSVRDPRTKETFDPRRYRGPASNEAASQNNAPQLPEPLRNVPGLQYSASRGQYKDANGNVYDRSGNKVQ
jgi:hypothetical protein